MVRRRKGFTLIELLVVITIIAVLVAILFPVFLAARAKAREMSCMANLKDFGDAFAMYQGDWNDRFPYTAVPTGTNQLLGNSIEWVNPDPNAPFWARYNELWIMKLNPYVKYNLIMPIGGEYKPQGIMRCKEMAKTWLVGTMLVPGATQARYRDEAGYGYNFLYLGLPWKAYSVSSPKPPDDGSYNIYGPGTGKGEFGGQAPRLGTIAQPAETICLVENDSIWAFPPFQATGAAWSGESGNKCIRPRHGGKSRTAVLWADGHVSSVETKYLVGRGRAFGDFDRNATAEQKRHWQGSATDNSLWDLK